MIDNEHQRETENNIIMGVLKFILSLIGNLILICFIHVVYMFVFSMVLDKVLPPSETGTMFIIISLLVITFRMYQKSKE